MVSEACVSETYQDAKPLAGSRRRPLTVVLCLLTLLFFNASDAAAQDTTAYTVVVGDRLSVSVFGEPELSGGHVVRQDGKIALHWIDPVKVAGRTLDEISEDLERALGDTFNSEQSVLVTIDAYRPLYILGDVQNAGVYPFTVGTTAEMALALAGGLDRGRAKEGDLGRVLDLERRAFLARNDVSAISADIQALRQEITRVENGDAASPLSSDEMIVEERLLALRRELRDRSIARAERQIALANDEVESLDERLEIIREQRAATEEQLARLEKLNERGLMPNDRLLALKVQVQDYFANELETSAFRARAKQLAADANGTLQIQNADYRRSLLADLIIATRAQTRAETDLRVTQAQLQELVGTDVMRGTGEDVDVAVEVARGLTGARLPLALSDPLRPGDVVHFTVKPLEVEASKPVEN